MRLAALLFLCARLMAEERSLTQAQRSELSAAILARTRAELAIYKLDSEYMDLRRKAV